jgi:hypothetical protein
MSVIVKGTTFSTGNQVTATNLNALVDSATFASGAVDNVTTQLSGGAIIVKDGGITSSKLDSNISIAALTATSAVATSIMTYDLEVQTPETGYGTSGTLTLVLNDNSNIKLNLTDTTTLAVAGQYSGCKNTVVIKNDKGSSCTLNYPAWNTAGGSFPSSLTTGQSMVITLYSYGTTTADVWAVSSI